MERVEALLADAESDPKAMELVRAITELYGEGLARIVAMTPDPRELARDELVAQLLVLHDLHPVPLEDRVRRALAEVNGVELVGIADGVVTLRGCNPAAEAAIQRAAPDVERIDDADRPLFVLPQAGVQ
jgi:hypothetical protein